MQKKNKSLLLNYDHYINNSKSDSFLYNNIKLSA